jgi:glycosyltransferase involved in cell wall biosynthesis
MDMPLWREMNCELLSTFVDGSPLRKALMAVQAYLLAAFKIAKSDIVHIHLAGQVSLLRKLPIAVAVRLFRKILVVHIHAFSPESLFESTPTWAVRVVLGRAHRIIALSEGWAQIIRVHLPNADVSVIPNPVLTCEVTRPSFEQRRIILFVGKIEPRKGYIKLLQAAPAILKKYPDVEFWLAGHGELDRAAEEAARLDIAGSVRLLGWTEPGTLNALYQQSAIFCLPSYGEGVPMSVLEAMSHGCPVVCTPVGGLPEIIVDGENGLFAKVGDAVSVGERILRLLEDPPYARSIGCEGRRTIRRVCGAEIVEKSIQQLYQSLLLRQRENRSSFSEVAL